MEYDVIWGEGSLGLTLRPDLGEYMPPVVGRITKSETAASKANVQIGHLLVSVNDHDTAKEGYDNIVRLLQTVQRPATLRFRVQEPSKKEGRKKRSEYSVIWNDGPLGMILRPDDEDCHIPCIRKLTGKGKGTGIEHARVGDLLISVNGQDTKSIGFRSTIALLKTVIKPAVLKYKRMRRRVSRSKPESSQAPIMKKRYHTTDYGLYDIIWRHGELGLKLKPDSNGRPIISRLTGKGDSGGLHNATVEDELVSVNGFALEGTYRSCLHQLKHAEKPATLRFRPAKRRRESMMSIQSGRSVRSAPHEPSDRMSRASAMSSNSHNPALTYQNESPTYQKNSPKLTILQPTREEPKRKNRIVIEDKAHAQPRRQRKSPSRHRHQHSRQTIVAAKQARTELFDKLSLDVAVQLVATAQGLNPNKDEFAGVVMTEIEDGTKEAHLLKVQAQKYVLSQAEANKREAPNVALSRLEREQAILEDALAKVQERAKDYAEKLAEQERNKILYPAIKNKASKLVNKQNKVIAELAGVIGDLKRDSYSDDGFGFDAFNEQEEEDTLRQSMRLELLNVADMGPALDEEKKCFECGALESEIELELDDDGEYYCLKCWEAFFGLEGVNEAEVESKPPNLGSVTANGTNRSASESSRPRRSSRSVADREQEDELASKEALERLKEIEQLRSSVSPNSSIEGSTKGKGPIDREERDMRGRLELAKALHEEEEKARKEGNESLARALASESARASRTTKSTDISVEEDAAGEDDEYWRKKKQEAQARIEARHRELRKAEVGSEPSDSGSQHSQTVSEQDYYREEAKRRDDERLEALARRRQQENVGIDSESTASDFAEKARLQDMERMKALQRRRNTVDSANDANVQEDKEILSDGTNRSDDAEERPSSPRKDSIVEIVEPRVDIEVSSDGTNRSDMEDRQSSPQKNSIVEKVEEHRSSIRSQDSFGNRPSKARSRSYETSERGSERSGSHSNYSDEKNSPRDDTFPNEASIPDLGTPEEKAALRRAENKNFALAKQLEEAHEVLERARLSFIGSDGPPSPTGEQSGLTNDQVALFKKLTLQAEERASVLDMPYDSASDSDSDFYEESRNTEEGDNDGVWI